MVYEHKSEPLLPFRLFARRLLGHAAAGLLVIAASLGLGVLGYHHFEHLSWLDSLLNASMILGGMGPVNALRTDAGKWFASFYALFSGVAFITGMGVLFAPVFHRIIHKFHWDRDQAS